MALFLFLTLKTILICLFIIIVVIKDPQEIKKTPVTVYPRQGATSGDGSTVNFKLHQVRRVGRDCEEGLVVQAILPERSLRRRKESLSLTRPQWQIEFISGLKAKDIQPQSTLVGERKTVPSPIVQV